MKEFTNHIATTCMSKIQSFMQSFVMPIALPVVKTATTFGPHIRYTIILKWRMFCMSKVPYFDMCLQCDQMFAKHTSTIDICKDCFEEVEMNLWGIGVPTE